jgi:MoxR-like ATPase
VDGLVEALARLDARLGSAVRAAEEEFGWSPGDSLPRGLYVERPDVEMLLGRAPLSPPFSLAPGPPLGGVASRFVRLADVFGLDRLELDAVLVALAPEVDARYERLYGYLQDNVTKRRPTVDLLLNLLTAGVEARIEARSRLTRGALVAERVIDLVGDGPVGSREIRLDEELVEWLLGGEVGVACAPQEAPAEAVAAAIGAVRSLRAPVRIRLSGPRGCGQRAVARTVAGELGLRLLETTPQDAARADRLARLAGSVLLVDGDEAPAAELHAPIVLATCFLTGAVEVELRRPRLRDRRDAWTRALPGCEVERVASRFDLTLDEIEAASADAWRRAAAAGREIVEADLFAAARAGSGGALEGLATRIAPARTWDDLVVGESQLAQLRELCDTVGERSHVLDDWGFGRKLSSGRGVAALFSGAPGTGKTLAAEVVANELGLDLFRIELAGVVSKYIGETEKNLDRIFAAAEGATAVLLFDEADALFGKRSEVRDSHDRFANIEISYLLQKMEAYEGLAILATNLRDNLDDAFLRRLSFLVTFPFPEEEQRRRIWEFVWPTETPLDGLDLDELAALHRLSGGQIKSAAVAAAYLAATDGGLVAPQHVEHALRREYEKLGRTLREREAVAS